MSKQQDQPHIITIVANNSSSKHFKQNKKKNKKLFYTLLIVFAILSVCFGTLLFFKNSIDSKINNPTITSNGEVSQNSKNVGDKIVAQKYPLDDILADYPNVGNVSYNVNVDNNNITVNNNVRFTVSVPVDKATSECSLYNVFEFCFLGKNSDLGVYFFPNPKSSATFKNITINKMIKTNNGVKVLFDVDYKNKKTSGVLIVNKDSMGIMLLQLNSNVDSNSFVDYVNIV